MIHTILCRKNNGEWTRPPDLQVPGLNSNRTFFLNWNDANEIMDKYSRHLCPNQDMNIDHVRGDTFMSFESNGISYEFVLTHVRTTPNW